MASYRNTLPQQMGVTGLGSCARRFVPAPLRFDLTNQEVFP